MAVAALCCVGAIAVIVFAVVSPAALPPLDAARGNDSDAARHTNSAVAAASQKGTIPPLSELQQLCARPLRQPLFDPPPPAAAATAVASAPPTATMGARLVGLVFEPGHSVAFFQKSDGAIALCAEGERFKDGGADLVVTTIEQTKVTISYADREVELKVPVRPEVGR